MIKISSSILLALFVSLSYSGCSTKQDEARKLIEIEKQKRDEATTQMNLQNDKLVVEIAELLSVDWKANYMTIWREALTLNDLKYDEYDATLCNNSLIKLKDLIKEKNINSFAILKEHVDVIVGEKIKEKNRLASISQAKMLEGFRKEKEASFIKYGINLRPKTYRAADNNLILSSQGMLGITVTNVTNNFITITSLAEYYGDKIYDIDGFTIPPQGVVTISLNMDIKKQKIYSMNDTLLYGFAVQYTNNNKQMNLFKTDKYKISEIIY